MISVTRLNKSELFIAAEQIESVEATPDTVVSLLSGRKVLVRESPEEILAKVIAYRRNAYGLIGPPTGITVEKSGKEYLARENAGD